ncbi:CDP-diacylglycerol--inositol 3-phosphatidyltransferase-like [Dysidea avara]|uniref:CDP-diacylglycerol--inositol 3-phosphatidyltransferase-like n=1 Tax=Dysidea avara TaxID=196820 RepID=UPI00332C3360
MRNNGSMNNEIEMGSFTPLVFSTLSGGMGHAAQCSSRFGTVLDMVTDRCVTTSLMVVLSVIYPSWRLGFQLLTFMHIASSSLHGESTHYVTDPYTNIILQLYYGSWTLMAILYALEMKCFSYPFIFYTTLQDQVTSYRVHVKIVVMCAGNELFFCSLYLLYFTNGPLIFNFLLFIDAGAWWLLLFCSTPIFVLKQLVSIIQLVVASQNIAGMDVADRARNRNQS